MHKPNRNFFSLIEMMLVLLVIAILLSFLLPGITKIREQTFIAQCSNNYKQIFNVMNLYVNDNQGYLPRYSQYDYHSNTSVENIYKPGVFIPNIADNTRDWHGHLAPYVYSKPKNNWNETTISAWGQEVHNMQGYNKAHTPHFGAEVNPPDGLKIFICPKASNGYVAHLHYNGLPFSYMGNHLLFGSGGRYGDNPAGKYTSMKFSDIKDPSNKLMLFEGSPHREPYSSDDLGRETASRAVDNLFNIFAVSDDPIKYDYNSGAVYDRTKGGSLHEGNGNHHWSMHFIHDNDQDDVEGYQMVLFSDGSIQKKHEWWLYLNAAEIR